ncbi:putative protein phosphatase 2C 30 [Hordeum vulgare]|nr:putative protein phosphatase 2C 30 [Hordeum vulgare]
MPPWAPTPVLPLFVLLMLLLLVRGRGVHGAITIGSLDMDMDMGVEAEQMGSEAAHGRLLWETGGGGRSLIRFDQPDRPDLLERIQADGGRVILWDDARIFGVLAMSRAIGDSYLKPFVIPDPEVRVLERKDGTTACGT